MTNIVLFSVLYRPKVNTQGQPNSVNAKYAYD